MPGKTYDRLRRIAGRAAEAVIEALRGPQPRTPVLREAPAPPATPTLADLERLNAARLAQAEQIFEFDVLETAATTSIENVRFFDVLLGALLAAQLVIVLLLSGRGDPYWPATLVVLGIAILLVCWGLALSRWAESGPVSRAFLADLAVDPAGARAAAVARAAGIVARNDARRSTKGRLFALAVALTALDSVWAAAVHAQPVAPPPVAATPSPAPPAPTTAPTAAPTPRPTSRPNGRPRRGNGRRPNHPARGVRTNSSR